MTTLTYNDIINGVLRLMDEHGGNAQFMNGSAQDETKRIIEKVSEAAVRKLHLQAPIAMLDAFKLEKPFIIDWKEVNGRYACIVTLPDDFFRLIRCRMKSDDGELSWKRPVSQLWWEDSVEYAKQKNRYLMGTYEKPIGFYVHDGISNKVELYSCESMQDDLAEFLYAPTPMWNNEKTKFLHIADRLKDASIMQIAADTLVVLGETERAQQMQAMATQVVNTYGGLERNFADNGNRIER